MSNKPTGGVAFPALKSLKSPSHDYTDDCSSGMTLRDYLAAKAMHQFLHGSVLPVGCDATAYMCEIALRAYEMADFMIAERDK